MKNISLAFGKRGNPQDLMIILILAVFFIFGSIIGYNLMSKFNEKYQQIDKADTMSKTVLNKSTNAYPSLMDVGFLLFFIGSILATIVTVYFIDTHPIYFVISLLVLIVVLVTAYMMSDVTNRLLSVDAFSQTITRFPIMTFIATNLFNTSIIVGGIILLVLYAKIRGANQ